MNHPTKKKRQRRCANCGEFVVCLYSCTCLINTIHETTCKHGKFYFCSIGCLAMHHEDS